MGREIAAYYVRGQAEVVARPDVVEHEGKLLHRLPGQRANWDEIVRSALLWNDHGPSR